ncbi:hypothetical protein [Streptomyces atriruber]|uniref:hypothetical protein n=1 Tax=Streptomyces atriruber TaxID=545121 RepID=UPI000A55AD52|nr:hypothetical protein [Streptomyces atriruber]
MTRFQLFAALLVGVGMTAVGLAWAYGPWGLTGSGIAVLAVALFGVNEKKE